MNLKIRPGSNYLSSIIIICIRPNPHWTIKGAFLLGNLKGGEGIRGHSFHGIGDLFSTQLYFCPYFSNMPSPKRFDLVLTSIWPPWPLKSRMLSRNFKTKHPRVVWDYSTFHCHQITIFTHTRSIWVLSFLWRKGESNSSWNMSSPKLSPAPTWGWVPTCKNKN